MLTLYINNKLADISDGTLITITKTYESISNPTLYYADYSKTVKLPISKRNNEIFSNFNRLDSVVTNVSIDPSKKIPFFILNNQEQVMEGYLRLDNANTIYTDEAYEVTLFSTLGLVMNELKLLTFNKNAVDVDPRYVIDSPINDDLIIDRNLVKQSFMQQGHQLNSDYITDWIGFIPTYQGKYSNFSSDKEQLMTEGRVDDLPREYDEHYRREFRSYYQQPYIWVDKLWKVAKDKIEAITDFTINLDKSWFTVSNPYYKDLIYTCPSLFNSDDTFKSANQSFENTINVEMFNKPERSSHPLTEHNQIQVKNLVPVNQTDLYDPTTGIFNSNSDMGGTMFKGRFRTTLYASPAASWSDSKWGKIRKDNPFYVKVKAVRASDGTQITGAYKTFLLYSCDYSVSSSTFDEAIDMGVCDRTDPVVTVPISSRPRFDGQGYHVKNDAHYWEAWLDFSINVTENVPYKMVIEIWNPNNGCPFEYSSGIAGQDWVPRWDWLWVDFFNTSGSYDHGYSFYFDSINITDCTAENMRSFSDVSLYRIFPKDVTLCDVLLNYSKMFGLVWTVDNLNKEINIMTRNRFFSDYHIEDWSNKIDRSKEFKFNPLNFDKKYVTFNFEEGKCGRLENYEDMYQYTYGTKKLDTGYDFNADENKLFTKLQPSVVAQKKQYSQMYNTTNPLGANFMGYNYMIYPEERYVDNDKDGSNAGMSGAFYFHNGVFTPDSRLSLPPSAGEGYYVFVTDDTTHQIQTGEYCWNMCGENMTKCYALPNISTISRNYDGKRYSVHFEKPKEYFFETPQGQQKYIYNSYWENYINERYCSQNKKLTAYVYLSVEDFARIDFREFIKIDNILYHIDKIYDYNFNTEEPVKMDLVQVWDLSAYTEGQLDFPYLFTEEENYVVSTTSQTIKVYASENWCVLNHSTLAPPHWLAVESVGDNTLRIMATSETDTYREGQITLSLGVDGGSYMTANRLWYTFTVVQYPNVQYRLDTDYHTVVFDENGGTQTLNVDCTDVSNGVITVQSDVPWLNAEIAEYNQTTTYASRRSLHLNITAQPNTVTRGRNGRITLSATMGGMSYQTIVNVGQQGGYYSPRIVNTDIITDEYGLEEGLSVLDENNNAVNYLLSNQTYHFTDLFPEEIDINSLRISQGTVSITGNAGEQTVTFTPQLANGDDVGGGVITAKTLNGIDVTYNYNVYESLTPTPVAYTRYVVVKSTDGGLFRIAIDGDITKTTDYYENKLLDNTIVKMTAIAKDGKKFVCWKNTVGAVLTTPTITFTVSSALVDGDGIIMYYPEFADGVEMVTLTVNGGGGNITVGNDPTQYDPLIRTVAVGTTITNIKATASTTFVKWSDGSTINPRDYTVMADTVLTPIFTHANQNEVTIDGGGLNGVDDYITLSINGTPTLKTGIGDTDLTKLPANTTYAFVLDCQIKDLDSKFNWFKQVDSRNTNYYYDNPASYNYQMGASSGIGATRDTIIQVSTVPSALYYTEDSAQDYFSDLHATQDWLLDDNIFKPVEIMKGEETKFDCQQYGKLTIAIPSDYKIEYIMNDLGEDITGEFTIEETDNGSWWLLYNADTREAAAMVFMLNLV